METSRQNNTFQSVATSVRSQQPYKEMNNNAYLTLTIVSYFVQLVLSILVKDIGIMFELIAALSYSNVSFTLPGLFFLLAVNKYGTKKLQQKATPQKVEAIIFIVFGIFVLGILLGNIIMTLSKQKKPVK